MDDRRVWRLLPAAHPDLPVLLVSAAFGPASYAIFLTDLAHVWAEHLDRRALCMRAFQENTAIDPSYENEQMSVFLGKLRAALDASLPDHANTSLAVSRQDEGDDDGLVLRVTSILPQGLPPLKWPVHLKRQPAASVAAELVLPLVQDRVRRLAEVDALMASLHEKDAVINKLVDKLEAMGAGAESAFPALTKGGGGGSGGGGFAGSGKRRMSRTDVERRVKGLIPFSEPDFRKQMESRVAVERSDSPDVVKLVEGVFGGANELRREAETVEAIGPSLEGWWSKLSTGAGLSLSRIAKEPTEGREGQSSADHDENAGNESDESFQTTPKRPLSAKKDRNDAAKEPAEPKSPTPKGTVAPSKQKAEIGKVLRLGAIGKKKAASPPPPTRQDEKDKESEDDDTASEAEEKRSSRRRSLELKSSVKRSAEVKDDVEDNENAEDEEPKSPTVSKTSLRSKPQRAGLGRIGGKKEQKEPAAESRGKQPSLAPPSPGSKSSVSPKPAKRRLGGIGGKIAGAPVTKKQDIGQAKQDTDTDATASDDEGEEASPMADKGTKTTQPKTDTQLPDRKRAEIIQQAVEKHAAPVRKKRKF